MKNRVLFLALFLSQFVAFPLLMAQEGGGQKFTSKEKKYNDWSAYVMIGTPLIQGSDLNSISNGDINLGYDLKVGVEKQITHAFGLILEYQFGKTNQEASGWGAETEYNGVSLLGDINLSNIGRRIDNNSPFRWSIHAYGGFGLMGFTPTTWQQDGNGNITGNGFRLEQERGGNFIDSFYAQAGGGLKFKINKKFDAEFRGMFVYTGDEEFDGSGAPQDPAFNGALPGFDTNPRPYDIEEGRDDIFWTASLGVHYKIGKKDSHLAWVNPLDELYDEVAKARHQLRNIKVDIPPVCAAGDLDDDGVCDDWDRELDTPKGTRVDGAGKAMDTDYDGVPDYEDACPGRHGEQTEDPATNGCPALGSETVTDEINLSDIEFITNEAKWYEEYNAKLDDAVKIVLLNPDANFILEGHTDARGSSSYNLRLSQRRANAIKKYFTDRGVPPNQIVAIGKGETEIINECKNGVECTDEQHRKNRRVLLRSDRKLTRE